MISLCEQCCYYDGEHTREIKTVLKDVGIEMKSIWCNKTDEPEDERWKRCENFAPYGRW